MGEEETIHPCEGEHGGATFDKVKGVEQPIKEAFEAIYAQHHERVYSHSLRLTGNEEEARGITEEAFLHLFEMLETFRSAATFYETYVQHYAQCSQVAEFVAEWICCQSAHYRQVLGEGVRSGKRHWNDEGGLPCGGSL